MPTKKRKNSDNAGPSSCKKPRREPRSSQWLDQKDFEADGFLHYIVMHVPENILPDVTDQLKNAHVVETVARNGGMNIAEANIALDRFHEGSMVDNEMQIYLYIVPRLLGGIFEVLTQHDLGPYLRYYKRRPVHTEVGHLEEEVREEYHPPK